MHPDLLRLAELTDVDTGLDRVAKELTAARGAIAQALGVEEGAEKARAAIGSEIEALKTTERTLQRKLDEYKTRRQGAIRILETGAGSSDSAEKQLAQCEAILDETETEMLVLFEGMDALKSRLKAAEAVVAQAAASRGEVEKAAPGRIAGLEANQRALQTRRGELHGAIAADLRGRYDLLRASKKRTAVARVVDSTCATCHVVVHQQQIADIKRGQFVACPGCQRWLAMPT